MQSKRPPNLSLQIGRRPATKTIIELQTPVDDGNDEEDEGYRSSSPSSSSSGSSRVGYLHNPQREPDFNSDDISKDLEVLEQLRRSVHKNLRLRPIRSASGSLRTSQPQRSTTFSQDSDSPLDSLADLPEQLSPSPDSAFSPLSAYYTPLTEFRATPISAFHHTRQPSFDASSRSSQPQPSQPHAGGISPALLLARLSSPTHPLLIDTRPVASFVSSHIQHSVNMAIPSLILKRSRKPSGAFHSLDALRQFVTTEDGKRVWDDLISGDDWDGDVIVYDETMHEKDRHNTQATAWLMIDLLTPLLRHGGADFLEGGFSAARQHSYLSQLLTSNSDAGERGPHEQSQQPAISLPSDGSGVGKKAPGGLSQLVTQNALRFKALPEIERPAPSPQPLMPSAIQTWNVVDDYSSPSPAPSSTVFSRPQPPRRPSIPTLRRIDTDRPSSALPKLPLPNLQQKPNTLSAPSTNGSVGSIRSRSRSPSHLSIVPPMSPPGSARLLSAGPITSMHELFPPPSPSFGRPMTPRSPRTPMPLSPATARPEFDQPLTTEEPFPEFAISTILPNFLYLGPELTLEEHVDSLLSLGVKRIVNIAAECDDDHGLRLRDRFERYVHIPMRDTVEEDNITRGVRDVCAILGKGFQQFASTAC